MQWPACPHQRSVHTSDSPRVLVFLSNLCCTGPSAPLCGVTHLLVKYLERDPEHWAVPCSPFAAKPELQMALLLPVGSPVKEVRRVWRLQAGLPLQFRVGCHYQHTEAYLILEPLFLFPSPPAVRWDFSWGRKCARSTAINPAYCASAKGSPHGRLFFCSLYHRLHSSQRAGT